MPTASKKHESRGQCVARRRNERGLTQNALAILCRCDPRTIQRIEADKFPSLKHRLVQALHKHLSMPLGEIVNGKSSGRKP